MTDKEIDRIIKANIQMAGFISLVRRMREAQKEFENAQLEDFDNVMSWAEECNNLEREVDEWLEKLNK